MDTTEEIMKQETEAPTTVALAQNMKKIILAIVMGGLFILFVVICTVLALFQYTKHKKKEKKQSDTSMET